MEHFLEKAVTVITGVIAALGYPGVFMFMALESACVPIPSEVVLVFAGFLAAQGRFSIGGAIAAGIAGALTGSSIAYVVGRFGGRALALRWGRFLLITEERLERTQEWFGRYGGRAVFVCRLITGLRAIISIPAGLARMSYPRFLAYTLAGTGLWVVTAVLIGYFVGEEWQRIIRFLRRANEIVLVVVIVIAVAAYLVWRFRRGGKDTKPDPSGPD
jgi:membrane protein DedA with SNARE-associated domain